MKRAGNMHSMYLNVSCELGDVWFSISKCFYSTHLCYFNIGAMGDTQKKQPNLHPYSGEVALHRPDMIQLKVSKKPCPILRNNFVNARFLVLQRY
jgi:hypothetical protein